MSTPTIPTASETAGLPARSPRRFSPESSKYDPLILEWTYRFRYVTAEQIRRLLFTPSSEPFAKVRLRLLGQHGYLAHFDRPGAGRNPPQVHYLTAKGVSFVARRLKFAGGGADYDTRRITRDSDTVEHTLAINEVWVSAHLACERLGYSLEWTSEPQLRRLIGREVAVKGKDGQPELIVVPDGYMVVRVPTPDGGEVDFRFAVEMERGVVNEKDFRDKIRGYFYWLKTRRYFDQFGTNDLRVLIVAWHGGPEEELETNRRQQRVATSEVSYEAGLSNPGSRLWFAPLHRLVVTPEGPQKALNLTYERFLTAPIWNTAGGHEGLPLISERYLG